ncbi:hypothetical protein D3273_06700 [Lichenibacterium minor]|uniref:Gluconolactonase n=1 Tax=Lichenibacterium minor TaxID=2316528 RepID=A0A4Q2U9Z1_9HYPH|nr:L-dopachrome tautomerase-related protein [Lichenibacterium minor]RYC32768.1 hypothetical protein D3273_06700 [Lichenibacterium minor]
MTRSRLPASLAASVALSGALLASLLPAASRAADAPALAEVWGRSTIPLGDPAFAADGRLVTSHHPAFATAERVSVFAAPDRLEPYPDAGWNAGPSGPDHFDSVQGMHTDSKGVMWMGDMGERETAVPKVVGWDTKANRLVKTILLPPPATVPASEPQDLAVDETRGLVVLADEATGQGGDGSQGALIVVDIASGKARRVLQGSRGVVPEDRDIVVDGRHLQRLDAKTGKRAPMRVGADGIALDARSEWLYFGPLNGSSVYRIRMADLADASLKPGDLEGRVERYAARPNAGGMMMDADDNLYLTEIEHRAVGVIPAADRCYRRVATSPDMLWPDGLAAGPDGMVYVTVTQLPLAAPFDDGDMKARAPFLVMRFKPQPIGARATCG